jgi:hypothetical protein
VAVFEGARFGLVAVADKVAWLVGLAVEEGPLEATGKTRTPAAPETQKSADPRVKSSATHQEAAVPTEAW